MPRVQSGSPSSSCLTTPTSDSSSQSGTKKEDTLKFQGNKGKIKNDEEAGTVADKLQQIEKEDDFDACKLRGMPPTEQRI